MTLPSCKVNSMVMAKLASGIQKHKSSELQKSDCLKENEWDTTTFPHSFLACKITMKSRSSSAHCAHLWQEAQLWREGVAKHRLSASCNFPIIVYRMTHTLTKRFLFFFWIFMLKVIWVIKYQTSDLYFLPLGYFSWPSHSFVSTRYIKASLSSHQSLALVKS